MGYFGKISNYNKLELLDLLRRESISGERYAIAVGCNHEGEIGIKFTSDRDEQDGSLPWWEGGCDDFSVTTVYSRHEMLDAAQSSPRPPVRNGQPGMPKTGDRVGVKKQS